MIISRFIHTIWTALTPYVNIYLSALVIEELAGERNPQRLLRLVGITLVAASVISLGTALLAKWKNVQEACRFFKDDAVFSKKLLDMYFVCVEDAKVKEQFETLKMYSYSAGWGTFRVVNDCAALLSAVCIFLGGIPLTITLFTNKVPGNAGNYQILNKTPFLLLLIGVMLLVTYIAPTLSTKASSYWSKYADAQRKGNVFFGYYGFTGFNKELATDMRIYRQDIFADKYVGDKKSTFCSEGLFAKLGWGPMGFLQAASAAVSVIFTAVVYLFVCLKAWAGAFGTGSAFRAFSTVGGTRSARSISTVRVPNSLSSSRFSSI